MRIRANFCLALILAASTCAISARAALSPDSGAKWRSLYGGLESNFTRADRVRVLTALDGLGIEYRKSEGREILVPESVRNSVQDLVAQLLRTPLNPNSSAESL